MAGDTSDTRTCKYGMFLVTFDLLYWPLAEFDWHYNILDSQQIDNIVERLRCIGLQTSTVHYAVAVSVSGTTPLSDFYHVTHASVVYAVVLCLSDTIRYCTIALYKYDHTNNATQ